MSSWNVGLRQASRQCGSQASGKGRAKCWPAPASRQFLSLARHGYRPLGLLHFDSHHDLLVQIAAPTHSFTPIGRQTQRAFRRSFRNLGAQFSTRLRHLLRQNCRSVRVSTPVHGSSTA